MGDRDVGESDSVDDLDAKIVETAAESPGRSSSSPAAAEDEEQKPPAGVMKAQGDRWNNRFELLCAFQHEH